MRTLATCSVTDPVTSLATFSEAAAAEHAAASENVAEEVNGSITEQVAKALTKQVVA